MTGSDPMRLRAPPADDRAAALARRVAGLAKPPGSLGRLEDLAIRLALVTGSDRPVMERVPLLLFAADHGLVEEGVSTYPAAVTAAMARTILAGRANSTALAAAVGCPVTVHDVGVAADLPSHPGLVGAKVRRGTRNAAREDALTPDEVEAALAAGAEAVRRAVANGADAIALGEMGIGNTATAALLMHRLLPAPLDACVGLGAGHDPTGLARKRAALDRAAARTDVAEPRAVLAAFGGLEIVAMTGAVLAAADARRPVVVDGFIVTVAALAAVRLRPEALNACVFAHRSAERGHALLLDGLGADPLLDLGLRLGEGTGALLAVPLLRAAARLLMDVASLDEVLAGAV